MKMPKRTRLATGFLWFASAALILMMLVVVGDVVMRAAFNHPVRGAYDAVSILLLVMVAFGFAPVLVNRGEIMIDLIDHAVGKRGVRVLAAIAAALTIGVIVFFGWASIDPAMNAWRYGDRSLELGIPQWVLWLVLLAGMIGILWAAVVQAIGYWQEADE
jgi:TRAP-type C4-dicarboxylate transport system permease small subunit